MQVYWPFDISEDSDLIFHEKASFKTLEIYQKMVLNIMQRESPVIEVHDRSKPMIKGWKSGLNRKLKGLFFIHYRLEASQPAEKMPLLYDPIT